MAHKLHGSVEIIVRHEGNVETFILEGSDLDAQETNHSFDASALFPTHSGEAQARTILINGISTEGRFVTATITVTTLPPARSPLPFEKTLT